MPSTPRAPEAAAACRRGACGLEGAAEARRAVCRWRLQRTDLAQLESCPGATDVDNRGALNPTTLIGRGLVSEFTCKHVLVGACCVLSHNPIVKWPLYRHVVRAACCRVINVIHNRATQIRILHAAKVVLQTASQKASFSLAPGAKRVVTSAQYESSTSELVPTILSQLRSASDAVEAATES
eukprot:CAMPEP_0115722150 /NCGR_PEP_ID=MMETSP0272-20121206/79514_1 /TAXON_ID=71861 /ORGANISM="Scrippsiella trochoidea, Strain CCMP3099" /LENGTH=181 /DNA_ID=CAMNT_0003165133 /DNA_START=251 /DNA_END=798 /DNA_ORIENTATION=+